MHADVLRVAEDLRDQLLFPRALETDAAEVVPRDLLDALARAGLYGLIGPRHLGGLGVEETATTLRVIELLAGGCLTTTFVWLQHVGTLRALIDAPPGQLRDRWLGPLCRGEVRSGVAFAALRRPGPAALGARADGEGGWVLDGEAPWVTGWGLVDVLRVAARTEDGNLVWALLDAVDASTLQVRRLRLAAVGASATVTLAFAGHSAPADRVILVQPYEEWRARDRQALRANGALALGVAARCIEMLGDGALDRDLDLQRESLLAATTDTLPRVRAQASRLALRAATRLVTATGGRALLVDHHAQRLGREALFLLVFGQTAAIRAAQLAQQ